MDDILNWFTGDGYFNKGNINIVSQDGSYVKGRFVGNAPITNTVYTQKVLVPATAKQIQDLSLGEYGTGEVFSLWVRNPLVFSNGSLLQKGDVIEYDGSRYKIEAVLNYRTHSFFKYTIGLLREAVLND